MTHPRGHRSAVLLLLFGPLLACIGPTTAAYATADIIDITMPIAPGLPVWESPDGLPVNHREFDAEISKGDECYHSNLQLSAHTGTHVDAPSHFLEEAYQAGHNMEWLPLTSLVGRALVVQVNGSNITAAALEALHLPPDAERLIFRTDNTPRRLLHRTPFDTSYIGITEDGARWLGRRPATKLVGIDYLSIGAYEGCAETHRILFRHNIIAVEGLNLQAVEPGWWQLTCAPLLLQGAEGAPARCFVQRDEELGAGRSCRAE